MMVLLKGSDGSDGQNGTQVGFFDQLNTETVKQNQINLFTMFTHKTIRSMYRKCSIPSQGR